MSSTVTSICQAVHARTQAAPRAPALPRRSVAAAGEGRSANRAKWASGDLEARSGAGATVLEAPLAAEQEQEQQLDASELVRHRQS